MDALIGFGPDLDPTTPGVMTDCSNIIPVPKGFAAAPSASSAGLTALAAACKGFAVVRKLDDTNRLIAGTQTKLYERNGTGWSDVSSGVYTGSAESRWRFCQFGDVTIATNRADAPQSSSSGAFAALGGTPPKASICETVAGFVMLFDVNDATFGYGDSPDRWWCSGLYNQATWSPSTATQAATGRLFDTPGKILAGRRLGSGIVAYKEKSMYLGVYQGPPFVWGWQLVSSEIGCASQEACVNIENAHLFASYDGFYAFDGTQPQPIDEPVRKWYQDNLNLSYKHRVTALHDRARSLVIWYFPSTASSNGDPDKAVVYNYKTGRWGRADLSIEAAAEYVSAQITYDGLGSLYSTYNDLPDISYDSPFWTAATFLPAVVNTSHQVMALNGAPAASSLTTGDMGDDNILSFLSRIRPRFLTTPTTGSLTSYSREYMGATLTTRKTATMRIGRFDFMQSARWHRVKLDFTGPMEIAGIDWDMGEDSGE
ncbi:MAG TPA: hypothetical protein VFM34_05165 [Moraxellaceae bacterium]|nr:hypothetical protein [Moraxellaceae bacterium]